MSGASLTLRIARSLLGAGRLACAVLALLATLHVTLPHSHPGPADERQCPVCQVSRHEAPGVPEAAPAPAPPTGAVLLAPGVAVALAPRPAHAAPLPSRGPPASAPSEPL